MTAKQVGGPVAAPANAGDHATAMELKVTYDPDANAAYIYLVPIGPAEAVRTEPVEYDGPGEIILDFDRAGADDRSGGALRPRAAPTQVPR